MSRVALVGLLLAGFGSVLPACSSSNSPSSDKTSESNGSTGGSATTTQNDGGSTSTTQSDGGSVDAGPVFPADPMLTFQSASKDLSFALKTTPVQPPNVGVYCEGQLVVTDANGAPVEGLTIKVTPYMPTMGHPSAVTPSVTEEGNGVYLIQKLALSMPGKWVFILKVTGPMTDNVTSPSFNAVVDTTTQ